MASDKKFTFVCGADDFLVGRLGKASARDFLDRVSNILIPDPTRVGAITEGIGAFSDDVAAIMLTNPNTCGLFERECLQVAEMVHAAGLAGDRDAGGATRGFAHDKHVFAVLVGQAVARELHDRVGQALALVGLDPGLNRAGALQHNGYQCGAGEEGT